MLFILGLNQTNPAPEMPFHSQKFIFYPRKISNDHCFAVISQFFNPISSRKLAHKGDGELSAKLRYCFPFNKIKRETV